MNPILRKKLEEALNIEKEGKLEQALRIYDELLNEFGEQEDIILLQKGICLFELSRYEESIKTLAMCYMAGRFNQEIEKFMYEEFYEPNIEKYKINYSKNCDLVSSFEVLKGIELPKFDELEYWFLPCSETKYIIFDKQNRKFISEYNLETEMDLKTMPEGVYALKNEYNPEMLLLIKGYLKDKNAHSKYGKNIYLIYEDVNEFFEFLQVNDLSDLLQEETFIFLFGYEQVKEYFKSEEIIFPTVYINIARDTKYFKLIEESKANQVRTGSISYKNVMNLFQSRLFK